MNASLETLAQIDATAALGLSLSASAETGLTETTPRILGCPGRLISPRLFTAATTRREKSATGLNIRQP